MPAYNAGIYICDAIESVIKQVHQNWELIIVNDGSTDRTEDIVRNNFHDARISFICQNHSGVSKARNLALKIMNGEYFCFIDADDVFTTNSISSRLRVFNNNKDVSFVDGTVIIQNIDTKRIIRKFVPNFRGHPLNELLKLSERCFVGNTWMIKREEYWTYNFMEDMRHAEDICFYMSVAKDKIYDYTTDKILIYRKRPDAAMSDYVGLEEGYYRLFKHIYNNYSLNVYKQILLKFRIMRIMSLSHLLDGRNPGRAIRCLYQYLIM